MACLLRRQPGKQDLKGKSPNNTPNQSPSTIPTKVGMLLATLKSMSKEDLPCRTSSVKYPDQSCSDPSPPMPASPTNTLFSCHSNQSSPNISPKSTPHRGKAISPASKSAFSECFDHKLSPSTDDADQLGQQIRDIFRVQGTDFDMLKPSSSPQRSPTSISITPTILEQPSKIPCMHKDPPKQRNTRSLARRQQRSDSTTQESLSSVSAQDITKMSSLPRSAPGVETPAPLRLRIPSGLSIKDKSKDNDNDRANLCDPAKHTPSDRGDPVTPLARSPSSSNLATASGVSPNLSRKVRIQLPIGHTSTSKAGRDHSSSPDAATAAAVAATTTTTATATRKSASATSLFRRSPSSSPSPSLSRICPVPPPTPVRPPPYDLTKSAGRQWESDLMTSSLPLTTWGDSKRWKCCHCGAQTIVEQVVCAKLICGHVRCEVGVCRKTIMRNRPGMEGRWVQIG